MTKSSAAVKVDATDTPANDGPITALLASQWKARESGVYFNTHEIVPDAGTPLEHLLRREFWGNVSQKFKPGDTLIVYPRDGAWAAEMLVFDAGQNWAHVTFKFEPVMRPEFGSAPGVLDDFDVRRDPIDGWQVVRRSTGQKLKGGFGSAEDGRKWAIDNQRALKR